MTLLLRMSRLINLQPSTRPVDEPCRVFYF
jgi:hypothetical protein